MEYLLAGVIGVAIFAALMIALAFKEHRNKKRPPIHTCHQGHTCHCQDRQTQDNPTQCQKKAAM
jgi:hypothetical protein